MPASVLPPSLDEGRGRSGLFEQVYRRSLDQPEQFWAQAAAEIDWVQPWDRVLDDSRVPFYRWFAGARLNTCYNALDRHVDRGRADQLALIYDSPSDNRVIEVASVRPVPTQHVIVLARNGRPAHLARCRNRPSAVTSSEAIEVPRPGVPQSDRLEPAAGPVRLTSR